MLPSHAQSQYSSAMLLNWPDFFVLSVRDGQRDGQKGNHTQWCG